MKELLNQIENTFPKLSFDEQSHSYYLDGKKLKTSVSKEIEDFYEKFDAETVSARMAQYDSRSAEEIRESWSVNTKEACDNGTRVHYFGEHYPFDRTLIPSCGQEIAIKKFWDEIPGHIVPVKMELRMYHKLYLFAGTSDILMYDTVNKYFILGDYKTNKDLFKNYKRKTMLAPFERWLDSPFNKYQVQLSFYQLLFEQTGLKIGGRKLIWLLKTGEYLMYDTEDVTKTLNRHLELKALRQPV